MAAETSLPRQGDRYLGLGRQRVVHGAMGGHRQQCVKALDRHSFGNDEAQADRGDASWFGAHLECRLDGQAGGGQVVPGQVAPRVESHARGEARDEQLGRGGRSVLASVPDRLVDCHDMSPDIDVERVTTAVLDPKWSCVDGLGLGGVGHGSHDTTVAPSS